MTGVTMAPEAPGALLSPVAEPASIYEVLVAISCPDRSLDPRVLSDIDWEGLLACARHHSLLPLLAHRLLELRDSALLPADTPARLRTEFQENLFRNITLLEHIKDVLAAWRDSDISGIPYKGPVMAEQLWGSVALRECSDIDFLVRRQDVDRAGEVLVRLGYERVAPVARGLRPVLVRDASEEQFRHTQSNILLELQWAPAPRTLAVRYDEEQLWRDIKLSAIAGELMTTPTPENLMGLLAIHGWKHNWSKLIWVADLARLVRKTNIEWDLVERSALRSGWHRILVLGVEMVRRVYAVDGPLKADAGVATLAQELEDNLRAGANHTYINWHRQMLRARDSVPDQLKQLCNFIVTPGLGEYAAARLPGWAAAGYLLVRVARVLRFWPEKAFE